MAGVTTTSAVQQQVNLPAVDLRQLFGSLISTEGLRTNADLQVAQKGSGANMSVDVSSGSGVVKDDHGSGGGFYAYTNSGTTNLAIGASDPTNPRIDRIVIQIDDAYQGDGDNTIGPKVIPGTPTSGATLVNLNGAAAVPGSALLLANVLVPATATSIVNANIGNVAVVLVSIGAAAAGVVQLFDSTLGGSQANFDIQNISQAYNHLLLVCLLRSDRTSAYSDEVAIRFNNDSTSGHYAGGSYGIDDGSGNVIDWNGNATDMIPLRASGPNSTSGIFGACRLSIPSYTNTTVQKSCEGSSGFQGNVAAAGSHVFALLGFGTWNQTSAISRITIIPNNGSNFIAGSRVTLYGVL